VGQGRTLQQDSQPNDLIPPGGPSSGPVPPLSSRLFPTRSDDGLLRQLSEFGGPLARQLSGLAVSDSSDDVIGGGAFRGGVLRQGGPGGEELGETGKAREGGGRVPRSQGSLSRSSSRQNSLERVAE
jgi:hypothetical protein